MPLVRIDYSEHRDAAQLGAAVHDAIVAVYGIPERDRFQIHTPRPRPRSSPRTPASGSSAPTR